MKHAALLRAAAPRIMDVLPWAMLGIAALAWSRSAKPAEQVSADQPPAAIREAGRGRAATAPQAIPAKGWKDILWRTFKEVGEDRLPIVAGGVTFYVLLAIFPTLAAFVSLYGLFADVGEVSHQIRQMSAFLPPGVVDLLDDQMLRLASAQDETLGFALVVGVLFALWSANAGMSALFDGLNIAYGEAETRKWWKRKLVTLGCTAAGLVLLLALSTVVIALPLWFKDHGLTPAELWWTPFRWVLALALVIGGFAALYRYGPSRSLARWRWVWIGAVAAALGWLGGSLAFSLYVGNFANYEKSYGSLGAIMGFMGWIWYSAMAVLLGAELNAEIEHQTARDSTTGPALPLGARGARMADTVGEPFHGFGKHKKAEPVRTWARLRQTRP